ncbi:MAG: hypothetical protein AAB361_02460 [Patescibacteria group bacterium]
MKNKLKIFLPIFIIIYCLIIVILYKYSFYLRKPIGFDWAQIKQYFITSGNYKNEPVVLYPNWLKPYAVININTGRGLPLNLNIAKKNNNFNTYWLISMNKNYIPKNYQIVATKEFKNLFVFKLEKITSP